MLTLTIVFFSKNTLSFRVTFTAKSSLSSSNDISPGAAYSGVYPLFSKLRVIAMKLIPSFSARSLY